MDLSSDESPLDGHPGAVLRYDNTAGARILWRQLMSSGGNQLPSCDCTCMNQRTEPEHSGKTWEEDPDEIGR